LKIDITIKIAGEAGQGLQTIGQLLAKSFSRKGFFVFANQALQSRIRGGHNCFQIRVSDAPLPAPNETTDILIALDKESVSHFKELTQTSVTIFDSVLSKINPGAEYRSAPAGFSIDIPLEKTAKDSGGSRLMTNTVAVGAVLGLLEYDLQVLFELLRESFSDKGKETAEVNIKIAQAGYDYTYKKVAGNKLPSLNTAAGPRKMLVNGSEAVALGALAFVALPGPPTQK